MITFNPTVQSWDSEHISFTATINVINLLRPPSNIQGKMKIGEYISNAPASTS
jgi:hypothetical protein